MAAEDNSGLYFFDPSGLPGADEYRVELARQRAESRRRYTDYLATVLIGCDDVTDPSARAAVILDALTVWRRDESVQPCRCGCHPRLPESDFHEFGFGCNCMKTPEQRNRDRDDWLAERGAFWDSPEGRAITAARTAEEAELQAWLDEHPEVVVTSHGGLAPEQWEGSVDGHTFYFRERHDDWRIELDLRPSSHFAKRYLGGDLDDESSFEMVDIERGDVIAEGTVRTHGYGESPLQRMQFIVDTIREHLAPQRCALHTGAVRDDLAALLGSQLRWCPACGLRLS